MWACVSNRNAVHRKNTLHTWRTHAACCATTKLRSEIKAFKLANNKGRHATESSKLIGHAERSAARTRRVGIGIVWVAHRSCRSTLRCVRTRHGYAAFHAAYKLTCRGFALSIPPIFRRVRVRACVHPAYVSVRACVHL